ncbi:MAG: hypothetical protein ACLP8S_06105 [Solirubrobacteraceae bacterium]
MNLSGLSIGDPELLTLVSHELARTNVPARSLIFEVTELQGLLHHCTDADIEANYTDTHTASVAGLALRYRVVSPWPCPERARGPARVQVRGNRVIGPL